MTTNAQIPRRWDAEIDGIRWLPRLIDKARMRERGQLGTYLLGHSPVDHAFLERAGVTTEEFAGIVNASADDDAVLAALRLRAGWDEERLQRWSARFSSTYRRLIPLWDLDEGYRQPNVFEALGLKLFRPMEGAAMGLIRRLRRAP